MHYTLAFNARWCDHTYFFGHTAKNLVTYATSWSSTLSPVSLIWNWYVGTSCCILFYSPFNWPKWWFQKRILNLPGQFQVFFPSTMYFYACPVMFRTEIIIDLQSFLGFRWYHCSRIWSKCTRGFEKEKRREILYSWGKVHLF